MIANVAGMSRNLLCGALLAGALLTSSALSAQLAFPDATAPVAAPNPLTDPTANPGKLLLLDLEARFARDVAERGGVAFTSWFAEDGVLLSNGEAPITGRAAIAKSATWLPKNYQLTWTPTDAVMGPSGDVGYTWSHYEGRSKDANGYPVVTSGRFITIWRKQPDGSWKVALDAGANEPAPSADCCKVPGAK